MKGFYKKTPCSRHPEKVGAVCSECYDLALRQQNEQWIRQRKNAHRAYEERNSAAG